MLDYNLYLLYSDFLFDVETY